MHILLCFLANLAESQIFTDFPQNNQGRLEPRDSFGKFPKVSLIYTMGLPISGSSNPVYFSLLELSKLPGAAASSD
jgi:hypothetical protein